MQKDPRSKYRNPSSMESEDSANELSHKNYLTRVKYNFFDLILESGILDNPDTDSDDEEIVVLPPEPKEPPPLIDLEDDYASLTLSIKEESSTVSRNQVDETEKKKKVRIKKVRPKEESDSSSSSSREERSRKKHKKAHKDDRRSRSKSPKGVKRRIKTESEDEASRYYSLGSYFCKICNLTMNSEGTYYSHMEGKRHKKALKQHDPGKAVEDCLKSASTSKSSHNSSARIRIHEEARIQPAVEKLEKPCPGLHYVIEIRGLKETSFYCRLCDAPCSINSVIPHLSGYKHQVNLLKHYDPDLYDSYADRRKRDVERKILDRLKQVEKKYGKGKVTVEQEIDFKQNLSGLQRDHHFSNPEPLPGPSHASDFGEIDDQRSILDLSKGTFCCRICDADMNNRDMWNAHIIGKRHLKNLKKKPNEGPSKLKRVKAPDLKPILFDLIQDVEDPIVGLEYMRETQNPHTRGAQYNCFICGACLTNCDVVDHLLTQKHMTKFLERKQHHCIEALKNLQINQNAQLSIVLEYCAKYEEQYGRGEIEVFRTKE